MELIYLIIFIISCLIEDIENVLLKKTDIKSFKYEHILHVSEEPSLLQCAHRCRFIDKNSIVDFRNSKCTCIKYEAGEGQEHQGSLTGVFVNQKIIKSPQTTKSALTRVINLAFNKTAQQSTTYADPKWVANNAIDGNESTGSGTNQMLNQWLSVDLETTTDIMYMVLKGYYETYSSNYNSALVVETRQEENSGWITCKNIGDLKTSPFNFICDNPTKARFVKLRSTANCYITIDEFEVYARVIV